MRSRSLLRPFALIEDLDNGTARLFEGVHAMVTASREPEVMPALERADALAAEGYSVAGWIGYDAGQALEPRLAGAALGRKDERLLCLFAFSQRREVPAAKVDDWLARCVPGAAELSPLVPAITFAAYAAAFAAVKEAIIAGDIYQANLTFPLRGTWRGDPVALYRAVRPAANARYAALLFDGSEWVLSFSPELFFEIRGRDIRARPMKGTRPRGIDAESDRRNAADLASSAKDRAENLMIVDLMRNDLARIGVPGSVKVDALFRVETYPTVFQMTTGVAARLDAPPSLARAVGTLFPCGSITGAPKIRAMEIIREVESWARGPYCGAIGEYWTDRAAGGGEEPSCYARFNVAIRTLRLRADGPDGGDAVFGVGSGIVADSVLRDEWEECLLKARFIVDAAARLSTTQTTVRAATLAPRRHRAPVRLF